MTRPFKSAAAYYARYRPGYPQELIAQLAEATGVTETSRVLDLGCGPGTVAIPMAAHAGEVVAVDREPRMIGELRELGPANVTAVEASAEDVDESWGGFQLVTAGRSFHWFDAELVLARLAAMTPAVALIGDHLHESEARMRTLAVAAELIGQPTTRTKAFDYAATLRASAFSNVEVISVTVEHVWTPDELIGLAYSMSVSAPELFGDRRAEFEERIRTELAGEHREPATSDAVVGRR